MEAFIVDSFTDKAFKGNPAAVCILKQALSEDKMLSIAKEFNLSETAFIQKMETESTYSIRYFSPIKEIPLCGHATLASAKVLFKKYDINDLHFITFQKLDLLVQKSGEEIIMEFPVYETEPAPVPQALLDALGIVEVNNSAYNKETNILLLEISDIGILKNITPDFEALVRSHDSINGVLVTASSGEDGFDFHSRYFWPWAGSNEDPVTGATHTFLTLYWSKRLNKTKMKSFQASNRTGFMELELINDNKLLIKSQAVIVMEGKLVI